MIREKTGSKLYKKHYTVKKIYAMYIYDLEKIRIFDEYYTYLKLNI